MLFKGLIRPLKGLIRLFKGLIRPFKGLIRPLRALSRKPASLEAWLEVFLLERPKGVVWAPGRTTYFYIFVIIFRTPFLNTFS